MTSYAVRTALRDGIPRVVDELGDLWAILVAEIAAAASFVLGRSELEAVLVGAGVLAVRVVAGLRWPIVGKPERTRQRPMRERQIRSHLEKGHSAPEIARLMKVSERYVVRVQRELQRESQRAAGKGSGGATPPRHWYDHPYVRGTLTVAGFISLAYTIFRILDEVLSRR